MIAEEIKARMREIVARYPVARSAMLPCLHLVQSEQGYVTPEGIEAVAEAIGAKPDEVESVVTFYSMYHQAPLGRHSIHVCTSISCYLRGCDDLLARLEQRLDVRPGETSANGRFTLRGVECLAACGMAPALQVDGRFVENVTPERLETLLGRIERDEDLGDLVSYWRPMGNGGYTAADGIVPATGAAPAARAPSSEEQATVPAAASAASTASASAESPSGQPQGTARSTPQTGTPPKRTRSKRSTGTTGTDAKDEGAE
jgi:NADH-quinone oxidoreductase E subunit